MAGGTIKLNAEETLGQVGNIAEKMAEASALGPVPGRGEGASPIDAALNTVAMAAAEKTASSSAALTARGTQHNFQSVRAIQSLETQEETNATNLAALGAQAEQSGSTGTWV